MFLFLLAVVFVLAGIGGLAYSAKMPSVRTRKVPNPAYNRMAYGAPMRDVPPREIDEEYPNKDKRVVRLGALIALTVGLLLGLLSTIYQQDQGQAKIVKNPGGTISHVDTSAGFAMKAPWQSTETFDLRSRTATFAGGDTPPSYTDGNVQGREVTVSLGRVQPNVDLVLTYSLAADKAKIADIYRQFRSGSDTQENFTQQIIQPEILSAAREAPSSIAVAADPTLAGLNDPTLAQAPGVMTPTQFRGEYRDDVEDAIVASLNEQFEKWGVVVARASLQDIRFSQQVEESLTAVEVAQQREQEAQANLRATEITAQSKVVEAEQTAKAAVVEAQGEADANRLIAESLTPQVLQQRQIEAMGAGTVYVVPQGSTPFIQPAP